MTQCVVELQTSDSVFEMGPLELSRTEPAAAGGGLDEVDSLPTSSLFAKRTPQPVDPFSRGRRTPALR